MPMVEDNCAPQTNFLKTARELSLQRMNCYPVKKGVLIDHHQLIDNIVRILHPLYLQNRKLFLSCCRSLELQLHNTVRTELHIILNTLAEWFSF
jgi:hypothetical protein